MTENKKKTLTLSFNKNKNIKDDDKIQDKASKESSPQDEAKQKRGSQNSSFKKGLTFNSKTNKGGASNRNTLSFSNASKMKDEYNQRKLEALKKINNNDAKDQIISSSLSKIAMLNKKTNANEDDIKKSKDNLQNENSNIESVSVDNNKQSIKSADDSINHTKNTIKSQKQENNISEKTKDKKEIRSVIKSTTKPDQESDNNNKIIINKYAKITGAKTGSSNNNSKNKFNSKYSEAKDQVNSKSSKNNSKPKYNKFDLRKIAEGDLEDNIFKMRSLAAIKRAREKERRKREFANKGQVEKIYRQVEIPEAILVSELANQMSEKASDVIRELMKQGVMATTSQTIDGDTAEIIATNLGHSVKRVSNQTIEDNLKTLDKEEDLQNRAPIVTVMGHVDHGKTSLLDALKSTDIATQEKGGITQHIGAYTVHLADNKKITFIDTPGHEAFSQMRQRGADLTDIVILVVAADDGIKTQTIEAINHAKAAKVPIIVAINKIDKEDADVERVKNELLRHELVPEDLGGDIITVAVSAKEKQNLDKLEEAVLLIAEMQDLKANPEGDAAGTVVESHIDKNQGVVATLILERGNMKKGDIIVAGTSYGKIRKMTNHVGQILQKAYTSDAVLVYGLTGNVVAGDNFNIVKTEKQAKEICDFRIKKAKDKIVKSTASNLEELFAKATGKSQIKELPVIIKADTGGSVEAIIGSLGKIPNDEVNVKILHSGIGGITPSDVSLAASTSAIILGFNVRTTVNALKDIENDAVDIRYYSIIYDLIDDIKAIVSGMLTPIKRENYIGSAVIREVFNITKIGKIAGSYVTKGMIKRGAGIRLLRDDIVIYEGKLKTLKRFKEEVKEVREGAECGIALERFDDIQVDDLIEVFELTYEKRTI